MDAKINGRFDKLTASKADAWRQYICVQQSSVRSVELGADQRIYLEPSLAGSVWRSQRRMGAAYVAGIHRKPNVVLRTSAGDFDLMSGVGGPGSAMPRGVSGFDLLTRTHVEGNAAAIMQNQGIDEGSVYINNPSICPNCTRNLPYMLGPGRALNVVLPDGTVVPFTGK